MNSKTLDELIIKFNSCKNSENPPWAMTIIEGMIVLTEQIKNLNSLNERLQVLEEFKAVNEAVSETLKNENTRLKKEIELLEDRVDDHEQRNRNQCLLFHGIAEDVDENTDDLVLKVINQNLSYQTLELTISKGHIVSDPGRI